MLHFILRTESMIFLIEAHYVYLEVGTEILSSA